MKHISLRLFLTLVTFLVGISLTALWMSIRSCESNSDSQSAILESTVEETGISGPEKTNKNNGEIEIKYAWSLLGRDSLTGIFVVKNNSGETIYYSGNPNAVNQENQRSCVKQDGKLKAIKIGSEDLIEEQELKPNESINFNLEVPQNKKSFEAGFGFKIGSEKKEKIVWVKVKNQLKSYGVG